MWIEFATSFEFIPKEFPKQTTTEREWERTSRYPLFVSHFVSSFFFDWNERGRRRRKEHWEKSELDERRVSTYTYVAPSASVRLVQLSARLRAYIYVSVCMCVRVANRISRLNIDRFRVEANTAATTYCLLHLRVPPVTRTRCVSFFTSGDRQARFLFYLLDACTSFYVCMSQFV